MSTSEPPAVRVHDAGGSIERALTDAFGVGRAGRQVALGPLTTFRAGGAADWFLETREGQETIRALRLATRFELPVTLLGGGSNVLIGDHGVRGLVIRLRHGDVTLTRPGIVRAAAGVTLNGLVRWTVNRGLAGLQAWAGTPGTVGGALYGNAHFQGRLIGEQVARVGVADRQGRDAVLDASEMAFGYDVSRLQHTDEAALWAEFRVTEVASASLRAEARASLAYRKRTQPLAAPSAGCVFQNPNPARDTLPDGVPRSAGALIDRAGLKGRAIGHARVSEIHGNFIVGDGQARACDIRALIEVCRREVHDRFDITLRDEVVYLGEF